MNWMRPLNDENKLQFDEKKNKTLKFENYLKMFSIINFKTIRNMTTPGNIVHSTLNFMLMRPVRILRLPKNKKVKMRKIIRN